MKRPTRYEMATIYTCWAEYVDPASIIKEKKFYAMSVAEKMQIIHSVFGKEQVKEEEVKD